MLHEESGSGFWREAWKLKEEALRTKFVKNAEAINHKARKLLPLYVGNSVYYRTRAAPIRVNGTGVEW